MITAKASPLQKWIYASKIASWPKIFVPFLFGHCTGASLTGNWHHLAFLCGLFSTLSFTLAIVYLNDFGDHKVDTIKRKLFPLSGSAKTIPDGILTQAALGKAGIGAVCLYLGIACVLTSYLHRPFFLPICLLSVLVLHSYTFGWLRLNYRGGGEIFEMVGVGFLMPYSAAYLQSGLAWHSFYGVFLGGLPLAMSSALASGLSDEESDQVGGKTTFTTQWGNPWVRQAVLSCVPSGIAISLWMCSCYGGWHPALNVVPCLGILHHWKKLHQLAPKAVTRAYKYQKEFKYNLHLLLWKWQLAMSLLCLTSFLMWG
ncbi:MAG: prenyltransferase [Zetaproteobacteria bacterium]|nr:prenyltransferase [Zetaproteobacteria bacterium]